MKLAMALVSLTAMLLVVLGVPVAASLVLDARGVKTTGTVTGKVESINEKYSRTWRKLEVTFQYRPSGAAADETSTIELDENTYDTLKLGDKVPLRHQSAPWLRNLEPWAPAARLSDQTNWDWLRATVPGDTVRVLLTILGLIPLAVLWAKRRKRYFWLLLGYVVLAAVYWLTPVGEPAPSGAVRTAVAKVRAVHGIERIGTSEHGSGRTSLTLIQPMELVELEFIPEGRSELVVATDKITAGTFPGMKRDAAVGITYQAERPRIAQMQGGRRDYGWTNLATLALPWIVGLFFIYGGSIVLISLLAVIGKIVGRRRRRV